MEISINDGPIRKRLGALKTAIPAAAKAASVAASKVLVEKLADRVRELIPNKGGWYDIYKNGVRLIESASGRYEVTTNLTHLGFDKIDAATTLIWFGGGDDVGCLLGANNPWTVDTIPSVAGGFSADIIIRPGSETEVEFHRRRQRANQAAVATMLGRLSRSVDPNGLPVVNGRVMADVPFLARRLEHGLGGFPRTQIWGCVPAERALLEGHPDVKAAGQKALDGEFKKHLR